MKPVSSTTQPSSYRDSFFKSKCASTTNLFTDVKTYQVAHPVAKKAIAAKSVNFLASKLSESESSLGDEDDGEDVDEDDDSSSTTSENVGQFEIVVDSNKTKNIDPVVDTVDLVREKMNIEAERVAYEQKLNEMRVHFNQKLSMFEDNERKIMQDRINTLQGMYNDLKFNFQKNLETDVKSLRSQLSESQSYSAKLMSELNKCTCHKVGILSFYPFGPMTGYGRYLFNPYHNQQVALLADYGSEVSIDQSDPKMARICIRK